MPSIDNPLGFILLARMIILGQLLCDPRFVRAPRLLKKEPRPFLRPEPHACALGQFSIHNRIPCFSQNLNLTGIRKKKKRQAALVAAMKTCFSPLSTDAIMHIRYRVLNELYIQHKYFEFYRSCFVSNKLEPAPYYEVGRFYFYFIIIIIFPGIYIHH